MIHSIEYSGGDVTECSAFATNAVAFFFVLSGFILTYVYHERLAQVGVVKFYFARFARIWPLHVVCMLVAIGVRTYYGQRDLGPDGVLATHLAMIQSWLPYEDWAMYLNGPAWSISTEFGFYFAFPVLLWLGRKRFWPLVLIFILALAMVGCLQLSALQGQITDGWAVAMTYVNPLPRMVEFVLGVAIGKLFIARSKSGKMDRGPESVGGWIKDTWVYWRCCFITQQLAFCTNFCCNRNGTWLQVGLAKAVGAYWVLPPRSGCFLGHEVFSVS